jgi:hypothetical protein
VNDISEVVAEGVKQAMTSWLDSNWDTTNEQCIRDGVARAIEHWLEKNDDALAHLITRMVADEMLKKVKT